MRITYNIILCVYIIAYFQLLYVYTYMYSCQRDCDCFNSGLKKAISKERGWVKERDGERDGGSEGARKKRNLFRLVCSILGCCSWIGAMHSNVHHELSMSNALNSGCHSIAYLSGLIGAVLIDLLHPIWNNTPPYLHVLRQGHKRPFVCRLELLKHSE